MTQELVKQQMGCIYINEDGRQLEMTQAEYLQFKASLVNLLQQMYAIEQEPQMLAGAALSESEVTSTDQMRHVDFAIDSAAVVEIVNQELSIDLADAYADLVLNHLTKQQAHLESQLRNDGTYDEDETRIKTIERILAEN